ncbi:MAG: TylF/MycF/NovP-related O-methyltransferase [Gallionella sp.]|nr:TylF/MycF/NovP-related O-methyltransferase [Gallionella sp.]
MGNLIFGFDTDQQWNYENGFYLTSHSSRLAKMVAHYELYKSIINLPGHVVECGVYKGASIIRFGTFREILESQNSRKIIGFDAFGDFPKQDDANDKKFIEKFESAGGGGITADELREVFSHKSFGNYELIPGDILETVPQYVSQHPELKIALLHIDVDVYKPSAVILEHLFDRVVAGGIIVFDDFGTVAGETKAIDEYFAGQNVLIEKLPFSQTPAYIRKK